jgi:hypothetical protein
MFFLGLLLIIVSFFFLLTGLSILQTGNQKLKPGAQKMILVSAIGMALGWLMM